ncbi:unnamed protein product, partial [Adineta steineri]
MKGHPDVAKCLCHYNALAEWNQIKTNEQLIKSNIEKYLEVAKNLNEIKIETQPSTQNQIIPTSTRKRTISSDDEKEICDPLFDPNIVIAVTPTFSKRAGKPGYVDVDESKPWVIRGIEKAKARIDAHQAKIDAKRLAKQNR